MTKTIGRLTKAKTAANQDQYLIILPNGLYAETPEGKRVSVWAWTRRNAIHQAKQMFGFEVRVQEARGQIGQAPT